MPESLGARLRRRREEQHVPLAAIAAHTKISLTLLEALERDNVSHWPGGIFRRSFVRAYAQQIGLDPDAVVRDFLEQHPEPAEDAAAVAAASAIAAAKASETAPPTRLRALVESAGRKLTNRWREPPADRPGATTPAVEPAAPGPALPPAPPEPDFRAAARVCAEFGRVCEAAKAGPLLKEVARLLDAAGLIVWVWDPQGGELKSALAHGYSDKVLARLPRVGRDADNATAAAFRSAQTRVVQGNDAVNGALAVPLMIAAVCVGVLAVELQHGGEQRESVHALATIFAAQLAVLVGTLQRARAAAPAEQGEPRLGSAAVGG